MKKGKERKREDFRGAAAVRQEELIDKGARAVPCGAQLTCPQPPALTPDIKRNLSTSCHLAVIVRPEALQDDSDGGTRAV